jgi:hypothetical protein
MKYGKDMRCLIEHLEDVNFKKIVPKEPEGTGKVAELMLQQQANIFMKQRALYYWEQFSKALQAKLQGTPEYGDYAPLNFPIGALKHIKQVSVHSSSRMSHTNQLPYKMHKWQ